MPEGRGVNKTLSLPGETQSSDQTPVPQRDMTEMECPICYQEYNHSVKCPRVLDCLHIFCSECLHQIQLSAPSPTVHAPPSISCPLCRHQTPLHAGSTLSLPPNYHILACLPSMAFPVPVSMAAHFTTAHGSGGAPQVLLSLEQQDAHFIILPTASLRVQQLSEEEEEERRRRRRSAPREAEQLNLSVVEGVEGAEQQQQRRTLLRVRMVAVVFWVVFVLTCVIAVVFGPSLFYVRRRGGT